jgi:hypothetical protein
LRKSAWPKQLLSKSVIKVFEIYCYFTGGSGLGHCFCRTVKGGDLLNNWKEKESGLHKNSSTESKVDETKTVSEKSSDYKLDQALADTFPASDPLPWTSDLGEDTS